MMSFFVFFLKAVLVPHLFSFLCECVFLRQTRLSAEEKDAVHPIEGDHIPVVQSSAELPRCLAHPHVHWADWGATARARHQRSDEGKTGFAVISQLFPVFYFYSLSKLRSAFAGKEISNTLDVPAVSLTVWLFDNFQNCPWNVSIQKVLLNRLFRSLRHYFYPCHPYLCVCVC